MTDELTVVTSKKSHFEQQLDEFFNSLPTTSDLINPADDVRCITREQLKQLIDSKVSVLSDHNLKKLINDKMNEAYYYGLVQGHAISESM